MTVTLQLDPELEAGLLTQVQSAGITPEEYLRRLVEKDLAQQSIEPEESTEESGMVWDDGLLVYGAGTVLPSGFIDNAVTRLREKRSRHMLGSHA